MLLGHQLHYPVGSDSFLQIALNGILASAQYGLSIWTLVLWTLSWLVALMWYAARMFPVWSFANLSCVIPHCSVSLYTFTVLLFLIQFLDFSLLSWIWKFLVLYGFSPWLLISYLWFWSSLCGFAFLGLPSKGSLCSSCTVTVTFIFNLQCFHWINKLPYLLKCFSGLHY